MEVRDIQMIYTIDNPKPVKNYFNPEEDFFTGVVKDVDENIAYYKYVGDFTWEAPYILCTNGKFFSITGRLHREDGAAVEFINGEKHWWYNGEIYGYNNDFTVESWIQKWKLEIFK